MKRIVPLLAGVCLLMTLFATPVAAAEEVPPLPHAFYGTVLINGEDAPVGTRVEAIGTGVKTGIAGNPITVTETGKYGGPGGLDPKLVVQGDIEEGATITFYVNDVSTGQTAEWHSGEVTELPLSVTIAAPLGPAPPRYYIDTNLFGIEASFRISDEGEILETIEATSEDGMLTITIIEGTIALDKDGKRLASLEMAVDESPPDPPEDAHIIGLAYDFGPEGATFDPGITLEYTYDPDLPEDVAEEDLVVAYYDEDAGKWVEVDSVVDTENNILTASVSHFTTFAIIGSVTPPPVPPADFSVRNLSIQPAEVEPGETVTIAVSVANTGGKSGSYTVVLKIDGVKEQEKSVTIAAGGSQTVSFSVTKEEAGSYTVAVNGLSGSFTVAPVVVPPEPPAFSVSYLSVSPRLEVEPGETVTITVMVANTGGESGSYTVVLKIDGVKEAEETVTVAAGDSQDVSFSVTREDPGSYTVAVNGLSGSFTVAPVVVPPEPPAFSVSYLSVSPRLEVEPGETVTITVMVANTGGESGSYTVVLKIDGVKEAEETVTVAAGESQDVSFSVTKEEAGSYTVAVNGLSGSFTVVLPIKPPGVNWPLIGGIIGGVIVVGLGVFFWWMRRRAA